MTLLKDVRAPPLAGKRSQKENKVSERDSRRESASPEKAVALLFFAPAANSVELKPTNLRTFSVFGKTRQMQSRFPKLLVICVVAFQIAMTVLWVRSYFVGEVVSRPKSPQRPLPRLQLRPSRHSHALPRMRTYGCTSYGLTPCNPYFRLVLD